MRFQLTFLAEHPCMIHTMLDLELNLVMVLPEYWAAFLNFESWQDKRLDGDHEQQFNRMCLASDVPL